MAGKISEYPSKTVFNDADLYDCSTNGTSSEKVTYSDLKNNLKTIFVQRDSWTDFDISTHISISTSSINNVYTGNARYIRHDNVATIKFDFTHSFQASTNFDFDINDQYQIQTNTGILIINMVYDYKFTASIHIAQGTTAIDKYAATGQDIGNGFRVFTYGNRFQFNAGSNYSIRVFGTYIAELN